MATQNQTPFVFSTPFAQNAEEGAINTIPQTAADAPEAYNASIQGGFPKITMTAEDAGGEPPAGQDFNGALNAISSHNFFQQNGGGYTFNPAVSDAIGGYPKNAVLWYFPENEVPCLVYSLINDNTNNFVDDPTLIDGEHWKKLSLGGGGGEIGDMGFAPLGIDESLNLRRYLNGQVISQTQFVSFTTKVKSAVALFPSLATTEANWQAEKALSKFGQVGKFVIDDENQTIRLPAVVNPQGLLSLSGIGNLVNESLPNITGVFYADTHPSTATSGAFERSNYSGTYRSTQTATANIAGKVGFSAANSSPTYQDNAPVQQEAVQYPYYIQVATGIEEELPAIREYKVNNSDYFGKSMYSDVAPDNASWLASNGSYNARAVYPDYYDWLVSHIGETITANGGKVVLSTDTYTDYDFVINQNDQTFRLPLLNGEENLSGDRIENLTLQASGSTYTAPANGAYYFSKLSNTSGQYVQFITAEKSQLGRAFAVENVQQTFEVSRGEVVTINYTLAGATGAFRFIYAKGNGTLYYYVGDTVQDASLINAGAVLGQLSDKISRTAASDKELVVGWGMPDYSAGVALSPSTLTTITTKGWINYTSIRTNTIGGVSISGVLFQSGSSATNDRGSMMIPVDVGDTVEGVSGGSDTVTFYPCKGV